MSDEREGEVSPPDPPSHMPAGGLLLYEDRGWCAVDTDGDVWWWCVVPPSSALMWYRARPVGMGSGDQARLHLARGLAAAQRRIEGLERRDPLLLHSEDGPIAVTDLPGALSEAVERVREVGMRRSLLDSRDERDARVLGLLLALALDRQHAISRKAAGDEP